MPPAQATPSRSDLHDAAIAFLLAHQGEHLSHDRALLVERCVEHIRGLHDKNTAQGMAEVIVLQALGDISSRGNHAHLDLSLTTSYAVFVIDPVNKQRTFFTVADLLAIARNQREQLDAASATRH